MCQLLNSRLVTILEREKRLAVSFSMPFDTFPPSMHLSGGVPSDWRARGSCDEDFSGAFEQTLGAHWSKYR